MRIVTLVIYMLVSTSASASNYDCTGNDSADGNKKAEMYIQKVTTKSLTVVTPEGTSIHLDRFERKNEADLKFAVYLDNTYDGYGGFVKVSVPKEVAAASVKVKNSFTAYYQQAIYSELGKVGEIDIRAVCH